jgi:polyphosphate kinase
MTPSDVSPSKAKKASQPKAKAEYLINREISWLKFNIRVLEEACNLSHPILERVRFLSISASNLDEFYMVRVAGLNARRDHKVDTLSNDGLTIDQQLKFIDKETKELIRRQLICWADLKKELYRQGVLIFEEKNLPEADTAFVERLFLREIAPALTPIIVDPEHPFPFIPNLGLALALKLKSHKDGKLKHALLPIPKVLERFTRLPGGKNEDGKEILRLIRVEKLIEIFLQDIFPHHDILGQGAFRVLRDTGLEIHEDAEDLVSSLEHALQKRGFGKVVRLTVEDPTPKELVDLISDELLDDKSMRAQIKGILGIRDLAELTKIDRPDLLFDPFEAQVPENLEHFREDCFAAIEKNDIVLHHPYESFDVVAEFLLQAARDPDVHRGRQQWQGCDRGNRDKGPI